jgi:hypothetical protein
MDLSRAILGRVALKNSGSLLTADVLHSGKDLFSGFVQGISLVGYRGWDWG